MRKFLLAVMFALLGSSFLFADNPFLPKFYENPEQYAFPLELFFMAERYKQLKDLLQTKDMFQHITISDYLFTKCLLFAKVNLLDDEFRQNFTNSFAAKFGT